MKRNLSILLLFLILGAGLYMYLLSPSSTERQGDENYQKKDFRASIIFYTKALAQNQVSFKKERLLFKLGNAYRLGGQRERALDFYMKILRDNPESVYRERIQGLLTVEASEIQDLAEDAETYVVDLSSFQGPIPEDIRTLKAQRDSLYLQLVKAISTARGELSYGLVAAYKRFQEMNRDYQNKKTSFATKRIGQVRSKIQRSLALVSMEEGDGQKLKARESVYSLAIMEFDSLDEMLQLPSDTVLDAVFIRVSGIPDTKTYLNTSRLLDLFEKAKVFLLLDDSSTEEEKYTLPENLQERTFVLLCKEEDNCRGRISEVLHLRSIWQSNG